MEQLHGTPLKTWVGLALTADAPAGMLLHTPTWATLRSRNISAIEEYHTCDITFREPKQTETLKKKLAAIKARRGAAAAAEAAWGEKRVTVRLGYTAEVARTGQGKRGVTYSVKAHTLNFCGDNSESLAVVGKTDIRHLQLFRDAGELLLNRTFDPSGASGTVTVHVTTMQLLLHLQQLPRPSLPALLTLFVWGVAHCFVALGEGKSRPLANLWHHGIAEGLLVAWSLVQHSVRTTWANQEDDVDAALSVLASIPRAALVKSEVFDNSIWPNIIKERRHRQGQEPLDEVCCACFHADYG